MGELLEGLRENLRSSSYGEGLETGRATLGTAPVLHPIASCLPVSGSGKTTSCSRTGGLIMVVYNLSKKPRVLQPVKGGSW